MPEFQESPSSSSSATSAAIRHSVCALDCPDTCAMLVKVEDGVATKLSGDPEHPVTRGFLCPKVTKYLDRQYAPGRLRQPLKRTGPKGSGQFRPISWDEALTEISTRLQEISNRFGSESILPYSYAGSMGLLQANGMDRRFFHRLGASRLDRTICSSAGGVGLVATQGLRLGVEPEAFVHARNIVAWGANIQATNVHLWPFVVEARRRGAKFTVIDPVATRTASLADVHLALNPGSDLALALGVIHLLFARNWIDQEYVTQHATGVAELRQAAQAYPPEVVSRWTGLAVAEIEQLATDLATLSPSVIRLNYGVQRTDRGGSAVRAIAMIPVLTGAWRKLGGGVQLSTSQAFALALNRPELEMPELQWASPLGREARLLNMSQLGHLLTDSAVEPPVKALVVYCSNPAAVAPDQNQVLAGLAREDLFTVVIEQLQTDTADYADIILPTTTFLEHTDLYLAYGHYHLQLARPALAPYGESRSNVAIFAELGRRMGFAEPCFQQDEEDLLRTLLKSSHPYLQGITLERLEREHSVRLAVSPEGEPFLPFAEGNFGGADNKANLHPAGLDYTPPAESRFGDPDLRSRFPLELLPGKHFDAMNSTFGYRPELAAATAQVFLHPDDATPRQIQSGDWVRLHNQRGELCLQAVVGPLTRPGVVAAPGVAWAKHHRQGRNTNVLTSQRLTDLGAGATFFGCLVEIERCPS